MTSKKDMDRNFFAGFVIGMFTLAMFLLILSKAFHV